MSIFLRAPAVGSGVFAWTCLEGTVVCSDGLVAIVSEFIGITFESSVLIGGTDYGSVSVTPPVITNVVLDVDAMS